MEAPESDDTTMCDHYTPSSLTHPTSQGPQLSPEERVKAKEGGVQHALERLRRIGRMMEEANVVHQEMDLRGWFSTLDEIRADYNNFAYHVGVAGDTGMGKTSLLNTLVSEKSDVAPSSQNGACTAAVCCIKFHDSSNYVAKIKLKSKEAIDLELTSFFQDMKDFEDHVKLEGSDAVARGEGERFDSLVEIISKWSQLDFETVKQWGRADATKISAKCKDCEILFDAENPQQPRTFTITATTPRNFLKEIKKYVDSTSSKEAIRWPLLETVDIYLQSDLLRLCPGLVLVDLPGEMDAVDARSQVARRYYNKLDRMMIVAPSDRASDNRTASELIREDQIHDMDAEGKVDDNFLAIIMSKIDQLRWQDYVDNEVDPEQICDDFPNLKAEYDSESDKMEELEEAIVALDGESDGSQTASSTENAPSSELASLYEQRDRSEFKIRSLDEQCLRLCIEHRSRDSKEAFQKYFDKVRNDSRMKNSEVKTQLPVFPVSSRAQQQLVRGSAMPAFPSDESTGFRELKEWIVQGSLPKREERADNILHRSHVLFDAMDGWVFADGSSNMLKPQLPPEELVNIHNELEWFKKGLKDDLDKARGNLYDWMSRLGPYESKQRTELYNHLTGHLPNQVDRFQNSKSGETLHWCTYAACIRRFGGAYRTYSKPRRTHNWQDRLYAYYWARQAEGWANAFSKRFPEYCSGILRKKLREAVDDHIQRVSNSTKLPVEYIHAFKSHAYKIENAARAYQEKVAAATTSFRGKTDEIRRGTRENLNDVLRDAFVRASAVTGRGKRKIQAKILKDFAAENAQSIIAGVSTKLHTNLKKARRSLSDRVEACNDKFTVEAGRIETQLAELLCRDPAAQVPQQKKTDHGSNLDRLKQAVAKEIDGWHVYWNQLKPKIPDIEIHLDEEEMSKDDPEPKKASKLQERGTTSGKIPAADKPPRKKPGPKPKKTESKAVASAKAPETSAKRPKPAPKNQPQPKKIKLEEE